MNNVFLIPIICIAVIIVIFIFFKTTYLTASPNKALIISGFRKSAGKPRVVIGGSTIRIPFLERVDEIALDLIQVDIKTSSSVPTSEDRKSTRLNSSHPTTSRMPSSA